MDQYVKSIIPIIESVYDNFTVVEKKIADFFIHNTKTINISSKDLSKYLYTSEATLTRFAQKCGFSGYREFVYYYQDTFAIKKNVTENVTKQVLNTYQELLNKSYALIDEKQIQRIVALLSAKKYIYIYGKGSSGLVANEIKLRFMRLGLRVDSITDAHVMAMNRSLLNQDCVVIGISISGKTKAVIQGLKSAKERGSTTVLFTSKKELRFKIFCDEIFLFSVKENLEHSDVISPQFPILIMIDIVYAYFLQGDNGRRKNLLKDTVSIFTLEE